MLTYADVCGMLTYAVCVCTHQKRVVRVPTYSNHAAHRIHTHTHKHTHTHTFQHSAQHTDKAHNQERAFFLCVGILISHFLGEGMLISLALSISRHEFGHLFVRHVLAFVLLRCACAVFYF